MPRFYKRKEGAKTRIPLSSKTLKDAVKLVVEGGTLKATAKYFNISVMTLKRYVRKYKSNEAETFKPNYRQRQIFTIEEEHLLYQYLEKASRLQHGLTQTHLRNLAFEYSVKNNKKVPDNWIESECASYDWYRGFMNRHPKLTLRTPEATSLSRATSFNRHNVGQFFDNLQVVYSRDQVEPQNIWNIDESGLTTVHKPTKIIAMKGEKQVGKVTSAERGQLVTICTAINASGNHIPPFLIFPRVNWQDRMLKGAPPGTNGVTFPSGWMTAQNFVKFLHHFKNHVKCSPDNKVMIIMDNHDSHISIESLNFSKDNGIILLTIPPHTSHKLQPLDRTIFGPFKNYYNIAAQDWMSNHPGKTISIYDIGELVGIAFPKAVTPVNITSGFKATGIWPLNRNIFSDDDYLSSYVTDRPINLQEPSTSEEYIVQSIAENVDIGCSSKNITTPVRCTKATSQEEKILCTPEDIRPYPKSSLCKINKPRQGKKKGSSKILTDTPIKQKLIEDITERQAKKKSKTKTSKGSSLKTKKKKQQNSSSEEENDAYSLHDSSDDEFNHDKPNENEEIALENPCVDLNDFVIVRFSTKKKISHYVGQVEQKVGLFEYQINFLRRKGCLNQFYFPEIVDKSIVDESDCIKLPNPFMVGGTLRTATTISFHFDFSRFQNTC